jgi:beta-lactamase superfamily II metal-dependent hydrolase
MLVAAFLSLVAAAPPQGEEAAPRGLTVVIVDVGQGDGIVIRAPNGQIHVIDAGPNGRGTAAMVPAINALAPAGYGFTFLSHFHDDHQGGLDELLNPLPFQLAYDRGDLRRTNTSTDTNNYLAAAGARRRTVTAGAVYQLGGGAVVRCIAVNGSVDGGAFVDPVPSAQEENSRSIALRLEYGQFSMWLGGDLTGGGNSTSDVEGPATLACGDIDVYKLNHHGSNTSTSTNLVARLSPELAVVSCGDGNSFGHPTPTVVNRINQAAAARALLCTTSGSGGTIGFGVAGSIRIDTDGARYRATAANGDFLDFFVDEIATAPLAAGAVRISEVQRNPSRVPDTNGEYVEVVNLGPRPVGLRGLRLSDNAASVTLASNLMLVPGRPLVVQVDGDPGRNGGLPLGLTLPFSTLALADTNDTVTLASGALTIDALSYSGSYPGGSGTAAERRNLLAAHSAANYAAAVSAYGLGDLGSPARRNDADATPHAVQIDVEPQAGAFVLRGTALAHGGLWSAIAISYGSAPGFPFLNATVPLQFDSLLQAFLGFPGAIAQMPQQGYRSLRVAMPVPNPLAGVPLFAAHVMLDLSSLTIPGLSPALPFVLP